MLEGVDGWTFWPVLENLVCKMGVQDVLLESDECCSRSGMWLSIISWGEDKELSGATDGRWPGRGGP